MLYWDVMNKLDGPYELSIYTYLKKHADRTTGTCFPSIATLEKETKISEKKIRLILKNLRDKKLITIQNRTLENGGKTSNIYKLLEFDNQKKEVSSEADRADQSESTGDTSKNDTNSRLHNNPFLSDSQAEKKYSKDEIEKKYDYAVMVVEYPEKQTNIDICMDIITTTVNSKKKNIRIQKEEIPKEKVIDKLLKLNKDDIIWVIKRFEQQPNQIHSPKAYLLTLLYDAHNQRILDCQNRQAVAAAAAPQPQTPKAVAKGTETFRNFTERQNNDYMAKILGQYSLPPEDQAADVGEESAI